MRVLVDKKGRTFERGAQVSGRPGVVVGSIAKVGNFFQIDFKLKDKIAVLPPAIVMHDGDVQTFRE